MSVQIITTVITPAASYNLVAIEDILDELQLDEARDVTYLNRLIARASTAAAGYCNRVFPIETVKDEFWPQRDAFPRLLPGGVKPLQLTRFPIIANGVTLVIENGVTLVDGTDYRVDYQNGQLSRLNSDSIYTRQWPAWTISVTYSAGYAAIPDDVVDAVLRLVRARINARQRDPMLKGEEVPGVYRADYWVTTGMTGNMPPDVADLLDNYRMPIVV